MLDTLWLHTAVHLKFLRRNRLLHGLVAVVVIRLVFALVSGLFFVDSANRFRTLGDLAELLHGGINLVTAGIGLLLLWSHRKARSIKMVATTAAPFEAWVGSLFLTAAVVGAIAHAACAVVVFALSRSWNVTYQTGFLYLALDRFAESLVALGCVTTIGAVLHPIIAVLLVTLVNESAILQLRLGLDPLPAGPVVGAVKGVVTTLYYLTPTFDPFGEQTRALTRTMRVTESDWRYLAGAVAYAFLVVAFSYCTTLVILQRKNLT